MRLTPHCCPECGESARGTCDWTPVTALLVFNDADDGTCEFTGESVANWDGQQVETDTEGRMKLTCPNFHEWFAVVEDFRG
jgi:hypothetical protein